MMASGGALLNGAVGVEEWGGPGSLSTWRREMLGEVGLAWRWAAQGGRQWPLTVGRGRRHAAWTGEPRGGANRWATTKVSGGCTGGQVGLSSIMELTEGGDEAAMVARNTVRGAAG
jgi:hypothetical protein